MFIYYYYNILICVYILYTIKYLRLALDIGQRTQLWTIFKKNGLTEIRQNLMYG